MAVNGRADPPTVLFLCVHNAGRSQMALGWFDSPCRWPGAGLRRAVRNRPMRSIRPRSR